MLPVPVLATIEGYAYAAVTVISCIFFLIWWLHCWIHKRQAGIEQPGRRRLLTAARNSSVLGELPASSVERQHVSDAECSICGTALVPKVSSKVRVGEQL